MTRLLVLALVLALALTACAPPRNERRTPDQSPVDVPDDWAVRQGRDAPVPYDWWSEFGDEGLWDLIDEALAHNPDVQATASRLYGADALAVIAGADRLPRFDVGGTRGRDKSIFIGLPVPGSDSSNISTRYTLTLQTTWELDLWGRLAAQQQAALADAVAAEADLAGVQLSLVAAVVRAWVGLIEARMQVDLAEANLESWRGNRELVERRFQAGLRSAVDLRLLRASEAAAADRLETRRFLLSEASRTMDLLLGRYPSAELELEPGLPHLASQAPPGMPSTILSRRPDLVAAERRLAAAELRIDQARAEFYPRIALTGDWGSTTSHMDDLLDGDFETWSLFGQAVQPIFEGGRLRAQVELADADSAEALAQFTGTLLDAFAEVESALDAEDRLEAREAALEVAATEARGAADLSAERYSRGVLDVITLFETERGAQDAEIELLNVRRLRLEARIELYLALGGGFEAPTPEEIERGALVADAEVEP